MQSPEAHARGCLTHVYAVRKHCRGRNSNMLNGTLCGVLCGVGGMQCERSTLTTTHVVFNLTVKSITDIIRTLFPLK